MSVLKEATKQYIEDLHFGLFSIEEKIDPESETALVTLYPLPDKE